MTKKYENEPSFYAVTPATVRYCKNISQGAKLLYGEITALSNKHGFCWASNMYFANLYGKDKNTISRWIQELKDENFIFTEVDKSKGNRRKMWVSGTIPFLGIGRNKNDGSYPENDDSVNNNINNNINNKSTSPSGVNPHFPDDENKYIHECLDGIKQRTGVIHTLPLEQIWFEVASWAYMEKITPEQFLGCYDHLKKGFWKDKTIKPRHLQENLPEYVLSNKQTGNKPKTSKIEACQKCDSNGFIPFKDGFKKCDHR